MEEYNREIALKVFTVLVLLDYLKLPIQKSIHLSKICNIININVSTSEEIGGRGEGINDMIEKIRDDFHWQEALYME